MTATQTATGKDGLTGMAAMMQALRPTFKATGIVKSKDSKEPEGRDRYYRFDLITAGETFQFYTEKDIYESISQSDGVEVNGFMEYDWKGNLRLSVDRVQEAK